MSDEPQMLRTIDWRSVFPFTQLFRAFRVAIHPAKLVLALLAIILVYSAGRTMDAVWRDAYRAVPGEVSLHETARDRASFKQSATNVRDNLVRERDQIARSVGLAVKKDGVPAAEPKNLSNSDVKRMIKQRRDQEVADAKKTYDELKEKSADAKAARDRAIRDAYEEAGDDVKVVDASRGRGLGLTFIEYQADQIDQIASGILSLNIPQAVAGLKRFLFVGPRWALSAHPFYFLPFFALALLVWSVLGGAIARIAAVQVSQDEKISVRQAVRFSLNKLMSFLTAPIMPLLLIGAIVLVLALVGWMSEIAFVGGLVTILLGIVFVALILVGILLACALIGWVCGFGLMYPTIAVEGSDAFDAVSRSFSYVFARPWKVFLYSAISLIYGSITYFFLRIVILITLTVLHGSLTLWTTESSPTGKTSIASAWTGPAGPFELVPQQPENFSLTLAQSVGSGFLLFWVYLFVALLAAYVLSFFVSANTIMYYLLRYEVDATEIDDVYLEATDEEDFDDTVTDTPPPVIAPSVAPTPEPSAESSATPTTQSPPPGATPPPAGS